MAEKKEERNNPPGYFKSPFKEYPGHIQFKHPFTLAHFKKYWGTAVEPIRQMGPLEMERFNFEWVGARLLLLEYGVWNIESVPPGDVREDNVPLEVVTWVTECAAAYIFPLLPEKKRALLQVL